MQDELDDYKRRNGKVVEIMTVLRRTVMLSFLTRLKTTLKQLFLQSGQKNDHIFWLAVECLTIFCGGMGNTYGIIKQELKKSINTYNIICANLTKNPCFY